MTFQSIKSPYAGLGTHANSSILSITNMNPVAIHQDSILVEARLLMKREEVSHLAVVNDFQQVVGILSVENFHPNALKESILKIENKRCICSNKACNQPKITPCSKRLKVRDIMQDRFVSFNTDNMLIQVVEQHSKLQFQFAPVTEDGQLVGTLTSKELQFFNPQV